MIYRRHKNKYIIESDKFGKNKLYLGKNAIVEYISVLFEPWELKVGDNTHINSVVTLGVCVIGSNCDIDAVVMGNGVHVHNHVKIGRQVTLGEGVSILPKCIIGDETEILARYSVVGPGVKIPDNFLINAMVEIRKSAENEEFFNYYDRREVLR